MSSGSKTRYAVLGILSQEAASGYDIKKKMAISTDHFWREGDGSIYPVLKKLLDEGQVSCKLENVDSGKPKKVYTITDEGLESLQIWLEEDPILFHSRNELLLKVFFGWNVEREVIVDHIKKFRRKVKVSLNQYRSSAASIKPETLSMQRKHQFLTLRAGVLYSEASLAWCDEALEVLDNE